MSKYDPLTVRLKASGLQQWVVSFTDLEGVLGFQLPPSARCHVAWWANTVTSQGRSWTSIGWRTRDVDIEQERVTFEREVGGVSRHRKKPGLTVAQAKAGLAARLGVKPSQVQIQIIA